MVIKAVAKGLLLDRLTYLRSPWNWLDFVVILSGYATLTIEMGNLAGLRTFRVLRALKTVSIIPGSTSLSCLPPPFPLCSRTFVMPRFMHRLVLNG